jgi:hypothetical protein
MNSVRPKIPQGRFKFKVGDLVRITKEKVTFAKGYEQTFSTEKFRVVKFIQRMPQPVYELSDLQGRTFEGQFYNYELITVDVSPQTEFQIDKLVFTRTKGGIKTLCKVERIRQDFHFLGERFRYHKDIMDHFYVTLPSDSSGYFFQTKNRQFQNQISLSDRARSW